MPSSKWSRSLSWLHLTNKQKQIHSENLLAVSVDYEKYMCSDSIILMRMIREMGFSWELDDDNSNQETCFDHSMTLVHWKSKYGSTYSVHANLPGFPSWEMFQVTSYSDSQAKLFKAEGGIDFRGAFFRFKEIMKDQAPEVVHFYDRLRRLSNLKLDNSANKVIFRRNRIDIAIDVKIPVDEKWECEYIRPNKNSKRIVSHHQYDHELKWYQSFSYIPKWVSRGVWIRVYNKINDIRDKKKKSWYPEIDLEKDIVTRMELVYYSPYAENEDDAVINSAQCAILGTWQHTLHYVNPSSVYTPLSAHTHFTRYAKNHGTPLHQVLLDVSQIEFREEKYQKE